MTVVAVIGISGVGKSTALRAAAKNVDFQHLVASDLIKNELLWTQKESTTSEALRHGDLDKNQELLVSGFLRQRVEAGLVVLDGHAAIDTGNGLRAIPATVFQQIGSEAIIFLRAEPWQIMKRRENDNSRVRPILSENQLSQHQNFAVVTARQICAELNLPLHEISIEDSDALSDILGRVTL